MRLEFEKNSYESISLRDSVYLTIREAILNGKYPPNKRLREIPLAEELGVSRTPGREAIKRLAEEHLVVIMPKCGAKVADYSDKDVADALAVRLVIENMAVKLAARYMTKDQVIELRDINSEMEEALKDKALAKITEADKRFHSSICAGANNQVLQKTMAMLDAEVLRYRVDYIKGIEDYMQLIKEHKELIDAIDARDEEKAEELMSRHIENQKKKVLEALESEKE